ncbi:MAG TPA: tetratricopeptide repeat protein, partial [Pyrinomonadaceae bacterium]|nr:tetratricopeptide repeat protein [Pyrinomonadaceae bacterium]
DDAIALYAAVAEKRPEAFLQISRAFIKTNRFNKAQAPLMRYIAARPQSDEGYYLLGYVLFRQGRPKDSLLVYEQAQLLKPAAADDLKIIGLDYGLLKDYERSAQFLEKSLAANAEDLEAHYYLGRVRFEQGRFEEARSSFEEVLRRDPAHAKAQNNLGQVYEAQNDQPRAMTAYRLAIDLDRRSGRPSELPFLNLGTLLGENGQVEEALDLLVRAAEINPASVKVKLQLGKSYAKLGRLAEAEREMVAATRLAPSDAGARYILGQLYRRQGKTQLAREQLQLSESLRDGKK